MDYQKIDAGLASAFHEVTDVDACIFSVFVTVSHIPVMGERDIIHELVSQNILRCGTGGFKKKISTVEASKRAIEVLTEQNWVKVISLSRKLRLLDS